MTFETGIPSFATLIRTPYGFALLRRFHEDGFVDLYVGAGRFFTVPGSTRWQPA